MAQVSEFVPKKIVGVQFTGQVGRVNGEEKQYSFFTDMLDLKQGDTVVCDTQYGPKTAIVVEEVVRSKAGKALAGKWIICKVDLEEFKGRLKKYELVQEIEDALEEQMQFRRKLQFYQEAASSDPKIAALVDQLQILIGGNMIEDKSSDEKSLSK